MPLKSTVRILEKALLRPGAARGDCERVCDIVRDMIVAESAEQLAKLVRAFFDDNGIVVVRVKDRFKHPSGGGWRDIMVRTPRKRAPCPELPSRIIPHIRRADHRRRASPPPPQINYYVASDANKHVCEVQLVHSSLLTARKGLPGHVIYGVVRNASEVLEFLGLLPGQRAAGVLALVEEGWSQEEIVQMGTIFAGEESTAGVSEALVAKDWNLLAIERMGLPVTKEMRDARLKLLQEKGQLTERVGSASLGVLLMQDITVVPLLVGLPLIVQEQIADSPDEVTMTALATSAAGALGGLAFLTWAGRYILRFVFDIVASARSSETFVALCLLVVLPAPAVRLHRAPDEPARDLCTQIRGWNEV